MGKKEEKITSDIIQQEYVKNLHKIGTATMMTLLVFTFLPALYVFIILGEFPGFTALASTVAALFGQEIVTWVMEPVLYFPMIGVAGAYMCFTAGNITNMRIPCALAAQNALNAKAGTIRGDVVSVFAMVGSIIVNFIALGSVILFGNYLLNMLPEAVKAAFDYAMPAVYGAIVITLLGMFAGMKK